MSTSRATSNPNSPTLASLRLVMPALQRQTCEVAHTMPVSASVGPPMCSPRAMETPRDDDTVLEPTHGVLSTLLASFRQSGIARRETLLALVSRMRATRQREVQALCLEHTTLTHLARAGVVPLRAAHYQNHLRVAARAYVQRREYNAAFASWDAANLDVTNSVDHFVSDEAARTARGTTRNLRGRMLAEMLAFETCAHAYARERMHMAVLHGSAASEPPEEHARRIADAALCCARARAQLDAHDATS